MHLNIVITKRGVYLSHAWRRGSLAFDPSQNKFQLRFPFSAWENWQIMLGLIWGQTDRRWQGGSKFHVNTHTHQAATSSYSKDNGRYEPLGFDIIILTIVVNNSGFPYNIFKGKNRTV